MWYVLVHAWTSWVSSVIRIVVCKRNSSLGLFHFGVIIMLFLLWKYAFVSTAHLKPDGTQWCMEGEVKGKLANGVDSQYSHTTSERGVSSTTNTDAHTSAASSRLNWRPRRFKWIRPFQQKTKSGFCTCAITFQTQSTVRTCKSFTMHRMNKKKSQTAWAVTLP